jgi:sec-independent protein translocase protein TatC
VSEQAVEASGGPMMSLIEHMLELKDHLVRIAIALVVCSALTFVFSRHVLEWLLLPTAGFEQEVKIIALRPTTTISMFMRISLFSGAILAMPFMVYQVLHYIVPGLMGREKRALVWIIPGATVLFLGGAAFAYFVMIPPALDFLFGLWNDLIEQNWTIEDYVEFVTGLVFWVGVSFQTPLVMTFVARLGVVTAKQMLGAWRFAVVGAAVLAAFITPTPDPINMGLIMAPLLALYFLGVLMAWVAQGGGGSHRKDAKSFNAETQGRKGAGGTMGNG